MASNLEPKKEKGKKKKEKKERKKDINLELLCLKRTKEVVIIVNYHSISSFSTFTHFFIDFELNEVLLSHKGTNWQSLSY